MPALCSYNPANWMLEQTAPHNEEVLGVDFTRIYEQSELARRALTSVNLLAVQPRVNCVLFRYWAMQHHARRR